MTKNSNRKGLALGAIFALVSSLFVSAPAAQANEAGLIVEPIAGTSYTMVTTDDFIVTTRLGSQIQSDRAGALKYMIEKSGTVGYGLSVSHTVSNTAQSGAFPALNSTTFSMSNMASASTVSVVAAPHATAAFTSKNQLRIQLWTLSGTVIPSSSAGTTVAITSFLDLNGNDLPDGTEPATKVTVTFVKPSDMGVSVNLTQPVAGDTWVTASASLAGINFQQLDSTFRIGFISTNDVETLATGTLSGTVIQPSTLADGNFSASAAIAAATASATSAQSLSAVVYYGAAGDDTIVKSQKLGVSGSFAFDGVTFSATVGDNLVYGADGNNAKLRVNSKAELTAWAFTGSKAAVSATQGTSYWFSVTGLSTDKYLVVNSVAYTDSAKLPTESSAIKVAAGSKGTITIETFGFNGNETITFNQKAVNKTATMTIAVEKPSFSLTSDNGNFAIVAPGASTAMPFTVKDQFSVLSARTNQRLAAYSFAASGFSTSATVSAPVTAGKGSATVTTLPATATGSATARVTLQAQNLDTGTWENLSTVDVSLTVTTSAAVFSAAVSPTSSPVSISYGASAYSWSSEVTVTTNVAGAVVTVAAKDLVIKNVTGDTTASDTIVARSTTGGALKLQFAGKKAGKYTVSYTVGSTTTTSQVVVAAAVVENASTVNLNTSTLTPGQTNTIVATLVDKLGNPIEVDDKVEIAYSGKGLPFNVGKLLDTDEDGKITFQVLVLSGETGTGTVTITVKPTASTTDDITVVKTLTIAAPPAPVVPEVNAVIGSFNNRVAVRVENAKGAAVSVKVGARWFKYTSLNDNYLWTVRSTKGRTLPVAVYVNGTLENVATITVK